MKQDGAFYLHQAIASPMQMRLLQACCTRYLKVLQFALEHSSTLTFKNKTYTESIFFLRYKLQWWSRICCRINHLCPKRATCGMWKQWSIKLKFVFLNNVNVGRHSTKNVFAGRSSSSMSVGQLLMNITICGIVSCLDCTIW